MTAAHGTCRACLAPMIWARMPSGRANPLDVDEVEPEAGKGVIAFDPSTGGGTPVIEAMLEQVKRWVAEGRVSCHLSHFATCPERQRFKRKEEG